MWIKFNKIKFNKDSKIVVGNKVKIPGIGTLPSLPEQFSFTNISGKTRGAFFESNEVTLTVFEGPLDVTISSNEGTQTAQLSINGGTYSSATQSVNSGDKIKIKMKSSPDGNTTDTATVKVGPTGGAQRTATWSITTLPAVPNQFSFINPPNQLHSVDVISNEITLSAFDGPIMANVTSNEQSQTAQMSVNGSNTYTTSQTVISGDRIKLKMRSSSTPSDIVSATLSIATVSAAWAVETLTNIPAQFSFTNQSDVPLDTLIYSNLVSLSTFDGPVTGTVSSDELTSTIEMKVNNGDYSSAPQDIASGSTIRLRMKSSKAGLYKETANATTTASVSIGSRSATWEITTITTNKLVPDTFTFTNVTDAIHSSTYTSNLVTLSTFDGMLTATVVNSLLSVNGDVYSGSPRLVESGDTVRLQLQASSLNNTTIPATLAISTLNVPWSVTTLPSEPELFSFTNVDNASRNEIYISETVTLSKFDGPLLASVSSDESSPTVEMIAINNTDYVTSRNVNSGDVIKLRMRSSTVGLTSETATLTIGTLHIPWTVTTMSELPAQFSFTDTPDVYHNTSTESNEITLSLFDGSILAQVSSNEGTQSAKMSVKHGVDDWSTYDTSHYVSAGDRIKLQMTSSSTPLGSVTATLAISTVSATWTVSTITNLPVAPLFTNRTDLNLNTQYLSNVINISSFEGPATISVSSDETSSTVLLQVNSNTPSNSSQQINPRDEVQLRMTSSKVGAYTETAKVLITPSVNGGSVTGTWAITTATTGRTTPLAFSFTDRTGILHSTEYESNAITLSTFDGMLTASVDNGEFKVNNGNYGSASKTVESNDVIKLKLQSSPYGLTAVSETLTVGSTSGSWSITTAQEVPDPFNFTNQNAAPLNSQRISNEIILSSFDGVVTADVTSDESVQTAEMSINGNSTWVTTANNLVAGTAVKLRMTSSESSYTSKTATLKVHNDAETISGTWSITTMSNIPLDTFSFTNLSDVPHGTVEYSNTITLSPFDGMIVATISGSNALMSVNGNPYSSSGNVTSENTIRLRMTSSESPLTETDATLTISTITKAWSVTTMTNTPAQFSFDSVTTDIGASIVSNVITLSTFDGIQTGTVAGEGTPQMSIYHNGSWSLYDTSKNVVSGDLIKLSMNASNSPNTTETATLTVSTTSATWSVTSSAASTTPDTFTIPNISNADPNYALTTDLITLYLGGNPFSITNENPLPISVTAISNTHTANPSSGIITVSINSDVNLTQLTNNNGFYVDLELSNTNPDSFSNTYNVTVHAGSNPGRNSSYTVSTRAWRDLPATPFPFKATTDDTGYIDSDNTYQNNPNPNIPSGTTDAWGTYWSGSQISEYDATAAYTNMLYYSNTISTGYDTTDSHTLRIKIEICDNSDQVISLPDAIRWPNVNNPVVVNIGTVGYVFASPTDTEVSISPNDSVQLEFITPTTSETIKIKVTIGDEIHGYAVGYWVVTTA